MATQVTAHLSWGILGCGGIARAFATALGKSRTGKLVAVGSRTMENARKFAAEYPGIRAHGSYEALLADPDVQAVYIATPHPMHAQWAIAAARAGKHILCEKPLGMNHAQATAIVQAARENDVFLMEAFMYRCHPQTAKVIEIIRQGAIGEVRQIRATFGFHAGFDPQGRLFKNSLGGGGILDVGCYTTSAARLIAGVALGKDFSDPVEVSGFAHLGATGVDEWAVANLKFEGDILAQCSTSVSLNQDWNLIVFGTAGKITVSNPWIPSREGGTTTILLETYGKPAQEIQVTCPEYLYAIEADYVAANLAQRQGAHPAMSWNDTLGNMKTMDLWRQSAGLVYESEKPGHVAVVHGGPLTVRSPNAMAFIRIEGVDLPVSRLGMGAMAMSDLSGAAVLYDDFVERGGNLFDTAYVYGGGQSERLLGQWIKDRNIRSQMVVLGKGAHTPFCTPEHLTRQLFESLDRLQSDYVDVYMLHRDNLDVPVGEFIDVLNEHKRAGRMRAFGGSNWTLERLAAANEYARTRGLAGMSAVSNNLSLARMVQGPWEGCLSCGDPTWREWLGRTQLPVVSWSSQASGFFTDRVGPGKIDNPFIARSWYSEDNFQRRQRAMELAAKRGVDATAVAVAYVLALPFPTVALIGPANVAETYSSFQALKVRLTPQEVAWLNLEA